MGKLGPKADIFYKALHFYTVYRFNNTVHGLEGQQWAWVPISELGNYRFPEANEPVVDRLLLDGVAQKI